MSNQNPTDKSEAQPALAAGSASCDWHRKEKRIKCGIIPGCCGCGLMYHTRVCEKCKMEFLDWDAKGFDDVCAGPYVTGSGDIYCTRCGPSHDRAQEEADESDYT